MCRECNFRRYMDDILPEMIGKKKYLWAEDSLEDIKDYIESNEHIEIKQKEFIARVIQATKDMEKNKQDGIG